MIRLAKAVMIIGLVNVVVVIVVSALIGDALNAKGLCPQHTGKYYLFNKGHCNEVTRTTYLYSKVHSWASIYFAPFVIWAITYLNRQDKTFHPYIPRIKQR